MVSRDFIRFCLTKILFVILFSFTIIVHLILLSYKSDRKPSSSGPIFAKSSATNNIMLSNLNYTVHLAIAGVQGFVEQYGVEQLAPIPGDVQNVFLLTTWRSGSTFFGEALSSHPAIFYHYEPLLYFSFHEIYGEGQELETAFQTLGNLSQCEYSRTPKYIHVLKTFWNMLIRNPKIRSECIKLNQNCFDFNFLKESCRLFPVQVFKLTRLRGKASGELLKRFKKSKLIYLVRDPRAIYSSRQQTGWCRKYPAFCDINRLCADLAEDLAEMKSLATERNKSVMLVKYENIAVNPEQNIQYVYTFLGLKWHNNVKKYLKLHTNYESDYILSTFKKSVKHIDKWKYNLANETVQNVQKQCKDYMTHFHYEFVK